jgi:hypothetical protein
MWEFVETHLKRSGFQLAPGCEVLFRTVVSSGESRLDQQLLSSRRDEAEANLRTFMDEMMLEAERSKTNVISEVVFDSVFKRLRPIWPFC